MTFEMNSEIFTRIEISHRNIKVMCFVLVFSSVSPVWIIVCVNRPLSLFPPTLFTVRVFLSLGYSRTNTAC